MEGQKREGDRDKGKMREGGGGGGGGEREICERGVQKPEITEEH